MRLVIVTAPIDQAPKLAKTIVEEKLAACANLMPNIRSIYTWKGKIEDEAETLIFFKTTDQGQQNLTRRIKVLHPYEVPEIISINIQENEGNLDYLEWVRTSVC